MSPRSVQEYLAALRPRYRAASRAQKGVLLSEAGRITGYHRKSLLRRLRQARPPARQPRGRPRRYDAQVAHSLQHLWQLSGGLCSKRLIPFLPTLLEVLERQRTLTLEPPLRAALLRLSPATADRLLRPLRTQGRRQPWTHRRAISGLQQQIPIRTFGDWQGVQPGAFQADLVEHCGETTRGFYLSTLLMVDVASGWTECQPVRRKGRRGVAGAVQRIRQRLPCALRELHTDNGGEFLNHELVPYCRDTGVRFTRGRPYRKNDQAFVEQKNWAVVRRLVGYDRYVSPLAFAQLERLYQALGPYVNFFQPLRRLTAKTRRGARLTKRYDRARTPYQRLLESDVLNAAARLRLETHYRTFNPLLLQREIERSLSTLWKLAHRGPLR